MSYNRKIEGSIKFNVKNNIYSYYQSLFPDNLSKACAKYQSSEHIQLHSFYTILTDNYIKFIYDNGTAFTYDNNHISKCSTFVKFGYYNVDLTSFTYKNLGTDNFSKDGLLALNSNNNNVLGLITILKEQDSGSYENLLNRFIKDSGYPNSQLVFYKGSTYDAIILHSLPRYNYYNVAESVVDFANYKFFGNTETDPNTDIELNFKVEVPSYYQGGNFVNFYIYETVVSCDCTKNDYKIVTTEIKTPSTSWNICEK
jgi:hypothetical protein